MNSQALPISRLISTSVDLTPNGAQIQNINSMLILGSSDVIDVIQRYRVYGSVSAIAMDFGTAAPEYLASVLWFEQQPQPTTLQIGRWAKTATSGILLGASLSAAQQAITGWNAVTTPGFLAFIDGIPYDIAPASFAGDTNLNGVASATQTALASAVAGTTCVWNANYEQFKIEAAGSTGVTSTLGFLQPPAGVGNYSFGSTQPTATDTVVIGGTSIEFVSGTPTGSEVKIGGTVALTIQNLLTFLNASVDANIIKCSYYASATNLYLVYKTAGAGGDSFTITAAGSTPPAASGATLAGGATTDISAMLGMTSTSSGAYVAQGIAAETAVNCVALFDANYGQNWYGVTGIGFADGDVLAVAAYVEAATNKHVQGVTTQESGVLSSVDTSDIAYQLMQLGYNRTWTQFSSSNPYAVCSLMARALTIDYQANNSVITLFYKQEPGIVPELLNVNQITALEAKNCNVFVAYNNNTAIIEPGVAASGNFIDVITGTDWLALTIQTAVYNKLYTSTTKIPQTDAGTNQIVNTIEAVCATGEVNDLLGPGTWNAGGFGSLNTGDFMPTGYYVYAPPVASQPQNLRTTRVSVPIQVAAKLSGAIQQVDILINVNQ